MSLPTIFSTCRPRANVEAGSIRDDEFMADLSQVADRTAPEDYLNPAAFFAKSYPVALGRDGLPGRSPAASPALSSARSRKICSRNSIRTRSARKTPWKRSSVR